MRKLPAVIAMVMIALLSFGCLAEELNEKWWNSSDGGSGQPETVYYPEFQLDIPESWLLQFVRPDGSATLEIQTEKGQYMGVPDTYIEYLPYTEAEFASDEFDIDAFTPGSYEFSQGFAHRMNFGGNQLDVLFKIRVGGRYGAAVCESKDGEEINIYKLLICTVLVPGDAGLFRMYAFIGGDHEYAEQVCAEVVENLTFYGGDIEIVKAEYPSYAIRSNGNYKPVVPDNWSYVSESGTDAPEMMDIPVYEVSWKYEAEGCNVEINTLLADGLNNEKVEFSADPETGVAVTINGMEQANRAPRGLENGSAEYVQLADGTQALVYSAVYSTSARTLYFEGALFVCENGVAMPFISSEQPVPEGLLETAMGLYGEQMNGY